MLACGNHSGYLQEENRLTDGFLESRISVIYYYLTYVIKHTQFGENDVLHRLLEDIEMFRRDYDFTISSINDNYKPIVIYNSA